MYLLQIVWKSVVVPTIVYIMDVTRWNESAEEKLEMEQNRVARMELNAPR